MSAMNPKVLYGPPEQAPLSSRNAYTTWPGGVDPTVPLYNTDNQKFGGARARKSRVNRKTNRKASRKNARKSRVYRKANRKNGRKNTRRANRNTRRVYYGGYQTCSPIDTLGSLAPIPMTGSVCPEGYFQNKNTLAW